MFRKKREPERHPQDMLNEMRLSDYDELFRKLKNYSWFEITSSGAIVAYKASETGKIHEGCMFMVPVAMGFMTYD